LRRVKKRGYPNRRLFGKANINKEEKYLIYISTIQTQESMTKNNRNKDDIVIFILSRLSLLERGLEQERGVT